MARARPRAHKVLVDPRTANMTDAAVMCRATLGGHVAPTFRDMVTLDFKAGTYTLKGECVNQCGCLYFGEWTLTGDVIARGAWQYPKEGYLIPKEHQGSGRISRSDARMAALARLYPEHVKG